MQVADLSSLKMIINEILHKQRNDNDNKHIPNLIYVYIIIFTDLNILKMRKIAIWIVQGIVLKRQLLFMKLKKLMNPMRDGYSITF